MPAAPAGARPILWSISLKAKTLSAAVVAVGATSLVAADVEYTVTRIPMPPGLLAPGLPAAINNPGDVVGTGLRTDDYYLRRAWIYRPGKGVEILPDPPGGNLSSYATDINDRRVIIGAAQPELSWWYTGWVYKDDQYTMLGGFEQDWSIPARINLHNQVVGESYIGGFVGNVAFYWTEQRGMIRLIEDRLGRATDISDSGWITGTAGPAFRMQLGEEPLYMTEFAGTPVVNYQGNLAGDGAGIGDPAHREAYFWNPQAGEQLIVNVGEDDFATKIAEDNRVYGTSTDPNSGWVWSAEGGVRLLTDLIDPAEHLSIVSAVDANDKGQIVGQAMDTVSGDFVTVVLTPVDMESWCTPDLDGNYVLDLFDFLAFSNLFNAGDLRADFDGSETLTLFDFLTFTNYFNLGC
jgi:hypothetical protein